MLLPNTSFWVFFFLWLKHIYNKEIKEGFAQETVGKKETKLKVKQSTSVTDNTSVDSPVNEEDKMYLSYINTIFKLQKPLTREEASLPIYGNIGVRVGRAIEIFGPFPTV